MVRVMLGGSLKNSAGGLSEFDVEAGTIRELLTRLGDQQPQLKPILDKGVAVAIDGQIYRNAWLEPVPPDSEVFILPRLAGG
ncbi:MAG: MoaD/ThiS family protein [Rhodospirillales bacterium]|nr:MoaD/ThiS family protein [Rhodospirillales bacterium]